MPPKTGKNLVVLIASLAVVVLVVVGIAAGLWLAVRASLPAIDGELVVSGLDAPVRIERDERGVPTVRAESHRDLAYGLGFAHGQDRFFQMDTLRRYAAGEISEIFGAASDGQCLAWDRQVRVQRFRSIASEVVAALGEAERRQLEAYTAGVNAGLKWREATTGPLPEPEQPTAGRGSPTICTCICAFQTSGTGRAWIGQMATGQAGDGPSE